MSLCAAELAEAWAGEEGTGGVMERRDGFRKNAYSPSEGENSLQLQVTSTSHTPIYWGNPERFNI